jgi:hypothetical protein
VLATPVLAAPKTAPKVEADDKAKSPPAVEPRRKPAYQPKTIDFDKLPKPIRALHACAKSDNKVEIGSVRYAKSTLFVVSCPAARGKLTPFAVYVAQNKIGKGAKRVTFEALAPDGGAATYETLFSVLPAMQAYSNAGDPMPNMQRKSDAIWLSGAWGPDDRPGVCAVSAIWRVDADKAELVFWEEAKECPRNALPKYETKVDKKPPPLVEP